MITVMKGMKYCYTEESWKPYAKGRSQTQRSHRMLLFMYNK